MAYCDQTPSQTLFATVTTSSGSITTSTSLNIVTGEPTTSTILATTCLSTVNGTCASSTVNSVVTTIPGVETTSTILIPISTNVIVTDTIATQTLFGSSCPVLSTLAPTPTPTPNQTPSSATPTTPTSTTTPTPSTTPQPVDPTSTPTTPTPTTPTPTPTPEPTPTSTPTPPASTRFSTSFGSQTIFTSIVTVTAADGSLTTTAITETGTPVLSIPIDSGSGSSKVNAGPIIGGVLGGLAGLAIIATVFWVWWRKRHTRWEDIWEDDNHSRHRDDEPPRRKIMLEAEVDPKPYEYGMIGTGTTSAPQSPGLPPAGAHGRSPSITPLLLGGADGHSAHTSVDMSSSIAGTPVSHLHHSQNNLNAPYDARSRRSSGPTLGSSREGSNSSNLYGSTTAPPAWGRQAKTLSLGGAPAVSGLGGWMTAEDGKLVPQAYNNHSPAAGSDFTPTADDAAPASFSVVRKPRPHSTSAQVTLPPSTPTASAFSPSSNPAFGKSSPATSTPTPTPHQPQSPQGITHTADDAAPASFAVMRKPRPHSTSAQITPSPTASTFAPGSNSAFGKTSPATPSAPTPAPPYQQQPPPQRPTVSTTQYPPTKPVAAELSPDAPTAGTLSTQPSIYSRDSMDDITSGSLLPGVRLGVVNPDLGDAPSRATTRRKP
ncbi:hypothetical protein FRB97_006501 [Tulasnella sp. 331]|nr:hypothetical protein FRB97_006501 [Tulasnella sp. 331]